jgi:hypothetical protein
MTAILYGLIAVSAKYNVFKAILSYNDKVEKNNVCILLQNESLSSIIQHNSIQFSHTYLFFVLSIDVDR